MPPHMQSRQQPATVLRFLRPMSKRFLWLLLPPLPTTTTASQKALRRLPVGLVAGFLDRRQVDTERALAFGRASSQSPAASFRRRPRSLNRPHPCRPIASTLFLIRNRQKLNSGPGEYLFNGQVMPRDPVALSLASLVTNRWMPVVAP